MYSSLFKTKELIEIESSFESYSNVIDIAGIVYKDSLHLINPVSTNYFNALISWSSITFPTPLEIEMNWHLTGSSSNSTINYGINMSLVDIDGYKDVIKIEKTNAVFNKGLSFDWRIYSSHDFTAIPLPSSSSLYNYLICVYEGKTTGNGRRYWLHFDNYGFYTDQNKWKKILIIYQIDYNQNVYHLDWEEPNNSNHLVSFGKNFGEPISAHNPSAIHKGNKNEILNSLQMGLKLVDPNGSPAAFVN